MLYGAFSNKSAVPPNISYGALSITRIVSGATGARGVNLGVVSGADVGAYCENGFCCGAYWANGLSAIYFPPPKTLAAAPAPKISSNCLALPLPDFNAAIAASGILLGAEDAAGAAAGRPARYS